LIQKNRPSWQRGLLNGVGGHIEEGEDPYVCMAREFNEEASILTEHYAWARFAILSGPHFEMHVFSIFTNEIAYLRAATDESVGWYLVEDLRKLPTISNVPWLVAAAIDEHFGTQPLMLRADYIE
jgi:8-oxo-dGTP diphosphatase